MPRDSELQHKDTRLCTSGWNSFYISVWAGLFPPTSWTNLASWEKGHHYFLWRQWNGCIFHCVKLVMIHDFKLWQRSRYSDQATGSTTAELWFDTRQGQEIFLSFKASRRPLGATRPPIQWVRRTSSIAEIRNEWSYTFTSPSGFMACTERTLTC